MLVALIGAAIATGPSRLVGSAVLAATGWWFVGMILAVALERSIF
jgi:hypothetical protein